MSSSKTDPETLIKTVAALTQAPQSNEMNQVTEQPRVFRVDGLRRDAIAQGTII
ncbi:hypothetical protein AB3R30_10135 [Leptolyngbyaceae cyanobacterium UHCC 1019]